MVHHKFIKFHIAEGMCQGEIMKNNNIVHVINKKRYISLTRTFYDNSKIRHWYKLIQKAGGFIQAERIKEYRTGTWFGVEETKGIITACIPEKNLDKFLKSE